MPSIAYRQGRPRLPILLLLFTSLFCHSLCAFPPILDTPSTTTSLVLVPPINMPGVRKSPANSTLAILTVEAPDAFKQLKDKVKGVFRGKKKDAPIESDNGVIVDVPVDATAVVSGGVPAPDGPNPAEPARVAGARAGMSLSAALHVLIVC